MHVSLRLVGLALVIVVWFLAYEGNLGKGLACLVSPGDLEVTGQSAQGTQGALPNGDTTQPL